MRSNARLDGLARALEEAYAGALDRVTAYALVGAAIGTVSAAVASSLRCWTLRGPGSGRCKARVPARDRRIRRRRPPPAPSPAP